MRCRLLLVLAVGAMLALVCPAFARPAPEPPSANQPADPAARAGELKAQGDAAMQQLHYEDALAAYDEAYALAPSAVLNYNRGRALQGLGRFPEALEELEAFERSAPPNVKERVPQLAELLADVRSRVATLTVTCNVAGARVHWKGQQIGKTPLGPHKLPAGTGLLEVIADGYHSHEQDLELPGTRARAVNVVLRSVSTSGVLRIQTDPAGASIAVDGRPVGQSPAEALLAAGAHRIVIEADGYESTETEAVVAAGRTNTIDIQLDESPGIAERWWFWTGLAVLVVGGVVITAAALTEQSPDSGDIAPGTVSAPLRGGRLGAGRPFGAGPAAVTVVEF